MNLTWDTFSNFVDMALEFIKQLLEAFGEWPLDLGIELE